MVKIILGGCSGKMGRAVTASAEENPKTEIVCGVDIFNNGSLTYPVHENFSQVTEKADVIVDFSNPSLLTDLLTYAKEKSLPCVLCATGYSEEQKAEILEASKVIPIFSSGNMSLGINLLIELAQKAAKVFGSSFDVEIIEKHHNQKIDAPSGTALMIADGVSKVMEQEPQYVYDRHSYRRKRSKNEIGIHAVRGGTIVGEHEIIFAGHDEVLTIKHEAHSKEVFAVGAVNAASFICGKEPGMYDMGDMLAEE